MTQVRGIGCAARCGRASGLALVCVLVLAPKALAHDPPEIHQLLWRTGSDEMVMITNRGLLVGDPKRRSLRLMCNEAAGVNSSEKPDLALLPGAGIMMATSAGLKRSADGGCSWQAVAPFGGANVPALAQHPSDSATLLVGVFQTSMGGIYASHDAGATFNRLLALPDDDFIQEILISPRDPAQLYASGEVFDRKGNLAHYLVRSHDAGQSWQRMDVAVLAGESDFTLLTLHSSDPQWVVAKTVARDPAQTHERLLISRDGGRSFAAMLEAESIYDATFAGDGETLWVGSLRGLWRSADRGASFEQIPGPQVLLSCVTEHAGALWACGYFGNGADGLSTSTDGGQAFETMLDFADVTAPLECDAGSQTSIACAPLWADWQREILGSGGGGQDALAGAGSPGVGGAGGVGAGLLPGSAGGEPLPRSQSGADGGGCSVRPVTRAGRNSLGLAGMLASLWPAYRVRRRRGAQRANASGELVVRPTEH